MENKFNDNELDRRLREQAEAPAPDGWDTPPEKVWTGLRSKLDARKKRRRFFLALWFALLAGLLGGVGYWKLQSNAAAVPTAGTNTEFLQKTEQPPTPLSPETAGSPTAAAETTAAKPGTAQNQHPPTHSNVQANITKRNQATETQNKPAVNTTTRPAAQPTAAGNKPESAQLSAAAENPQAPPQEQVPHHPAAETPAQASGTSMELLALLPTLPPTPPASPPALPIKPEPVFMPPVDKPATAAKSTWYAGAVSGLLFTSRKLQTQAGQLPNGVETGAWTWQQGMQLGWQWNKNWSLESGLQRTGIQLQAERLIIFQYRTDREKFNPNRYLYQNSTDQVIQTSFGEVDMRMDMGREPSRPILDQAKVEIILRTNEQVNFLRVPLLLGYRNGNGPWQWSLGAGLGINMKTGYDLSLTAARANRPGVRDISARVQNRPDGLAPVMLDAQFGAGLHYQLGPHWAVQLAPEFRYGLSSLNRKGPFRSFAVSGGLQLGLIYTFQK